MAKRFRSKRRAYRKGLKKSRKVGKKLARSVKKVVRSMETTKYENEDAVEKGSVFSVTPYVGPLGTWYRVIPKVLIGYTADTRPYYKLKPLSLSVEVYLRWHPDVFNRAVDMQCSLFVLTQKAYKQYDALEFNNNLNMRNGAVFLRQDGVTSGYFDGTWQNAQLAVNDNVCTCLKRVNFRMAKSAGAYSAYGQPNAPPADGTQGSGPAFAFTMSKKFKIRIPVPQHFLYNLQVMSGTPESSPHLVFPSNYAPVMGLGYYDNYSGSAPPNVGGYTPATNNYFQMNYRMKLVYKDM